METKFNIEISQEQVNYLQRLGMEVDGMIFLIDRIFSNHANDTDLTLFNSVPFQHYMKKYEDAYAAWELAKQEFQSSFLDKKVKEITNLENCKYNWTIDDYSSLICEVTLV